MAAFLTVAEAAASLGVQGYGFFCPISDSVNNLYSLKDPFGALLVQVPGRVHLSPATASTFLMEPRYSMGGSDAKESPAVQETQVQSLSWEDPLEKRMETHSSIPA